MPACWSRGSIYVKQGDAPRFLILDAAMNDLIRPDPYEAWHGSCPRRARRRAAGRSRLDVVGPVCETGDYLRAEAQAAAARRGRSGRA